MGHQYNRDTFIEMAQHLARYDIVAAVRRCDDDVEALGKLLVRLRETRSIACLPAGESLDAVLNALRGVLSYPKEMNFRWTKAVRARFEGLDSATAVERLLDYIGERSLEVGTALVQIDTLGDDYALCFMSVPSSRDFVAIAPGRIGVLSERRHMSPTSANAVGDATAPPRTEVENPFGTPRSGVSWLAVSTPRNPASILEELGLTDTGIPCVPGDTSTFAAGTVPRSDYYVVVDHRADPRGYPDRDDLLGTLASNGRAVVVACYQSSDGRESAMSGWHDGSWLWSVSHDSHQPEGPDHLDYRGNLPDRLAKIRAAAWTRHKADRTAGHLYRVPIDLASEYTGFTGSSGGTRLTRLINR